MKCYTSTKLQLFKIYSNSSSKVWHRYDDIIKGANRMSGFHLITHVQWVGVMFNPSRYLYEKSWRYQRHKWRLCLNIENNFSFYCLVNQKNIFCFIIRRTLLFLYIYLLRNVPIKKNKHLYTTSTIPTAQNFCLSISVTEHNVSELLLKIEF